MIISGSRLVTSIFALLWSATSGVASVWYTEADLIEVKTEINVFVITQPDCNFPPCWTNRLGTWQLIYGPDSVDGGFKYEFADLNGDGLIAPEEMISFDSRDLGEWIELGWQPGPIFGKIDVSGGLNNISGGLSVLEDGIKTGNPEPDVFSINLYSDGAAIRTYFDGDYYYDFFEGRYSASSRRVPIVVRDGVPSVVPVPAAWLLISSAFSLLFWGRVWAPRSRSLEALA